MIFCPVVTLLRIGEEGFASLCESAYFGVFRDERVFSYLAREMIISGNSNKNHRKKWPKIAAKSKIFVQALSTKCVCA